MKTVICQNFSKYFIICLLAFIYANGSSLGAELKESWQRDLDYEEKMHIAELIRGLDVPYYQRAPIVEKIVAIGMGRDKAIVEDQLVDALDFDNMQIRMAVIEIMARIGNANKFIPAIGNILIYEPFVDVRIKAVQCLPVFLIGNYKERIEALSLLDADSYIMTDNLKNVLRSPPLKRNRREVDHEKARTRISIIAVLSNQLDPIGTALKGLNIKNKQIEIKKLIENLTSERFEGELNKIEDKWLRVRPNAVLKDENFINTIQEVSCKVLVDIGAIESWQGLLELSKVNRNAPKVAAIKSFAQLTSYAQEIWNIDEDILCGAFLFPHDIYDWKLFCQDIQKEIQINKNSRNYSSILWDNISTEAKLTISSIAEQNDNKQEISDTKKNTICDSVNKSFANFNFMKKLYNSSKLPALPANEEKQLAKKEEELSKNEIVHLNRIIFEQIYKGNIRFHQTWKEISEEERIWRIQRHQECKNLIKNAFAFANGILNSESKNESLRKYAYMILGFSKKKESVPLLYDWAARKEPDRALLTEICEALGEIGGIAAVKALGQLSNYKGYSSSVTQLQREYRSVFTAFNALGVIARKPYDKGRKHAVIELSRHLNDKRSIPGLPSIRNQALWQLQFSFQEGRNDLTPEQWLIVQEEYLKKKSGKKLLSIEF